MVQEGQTAKVHYKGMLDDGSVFDSSEGKDPLSFQVGGGQVIAGVDTAVREMEVGETKTVKVGHEDAYGTTRDDMVGTIPRAQFPDNIEPRKGMMLQMRTDQGALPVTIVDVTDEGVKIDGNHPLAGKDLTFELTLVEVT
jgi:peptidylprolyl isomerase